VRTSNNEIEKPVGAPTKKNLLYVDIQS